MNWLLGKDRYNPLIRPAVNRTERVTVKLQVSLAQLISVVKRQIHLPTGRMCVHLFICVHLLMCVRERIPCVKTKSKTQKERHWKRMMEKTEQDPQSFEKAVNYKPASAERP